MNTNTHLSPDTITADPIRNQFFVLRGFANSLNLLNTVGELIRTSPWRRMTVAGGKQMSVAMSNCGRLGWTSDRTGYRYRPTDPLTGQPWPGLPPEWCELAKSAAAAAGFPDFEPDACLMNHYQPGARLGLHRDEDEKDFQHPIVSVSLGASARFVVGGLKRKDPTRAVMLHSGDVLVWGGADRLVYHGVGVPRAANRQSPVRDRYNLTFRKAGSN